MKTKTEMRVTFDGRGINDTDEYGSRIATFTEYGHADKTLGKRMALAVNMHDELLRAVKQAYGWMNGSDTRRTDDNVIDTLYDVIKKVEGK